jgi:hypothetical protein
MAPDFSPEHSRLLFRLNAARPQPRLPDRCSLVYRAPCPIPAISRWVWPKPRRSIVPLRWSCKHNAVTPSRPFWNALLRPGGTQTGRLCRSRKMLLALSLRHGPAIMNSRGPKVLYFVRTTDSRKQPKWRGSVPVVKRLYPELACSALGQAIDQAKRRVLASDKTLMLQADACSRNRDQVRTKYRCWIDERGTFNERALV